MRIRNFLLVFLLYPFYMSWNVQASNIELIPPEDLRQEIDLYARNYFANIYVDKVLDDTLKVTTGNLDSRLRLARCVSPLAMETNLPNHLAANATIKVTCNGANRWSIYVSVTIDVYGKIVVATRPLQRGAILSEEDLSYQTINIARYGSGQVQNIDRIIGQELTREINAGSTIKLSQVRAAKVVKKGDIVVLEARGSSIAVAVSGEAMENGHVGKQIRVRNSQSKRIVDGIVSGPGRVSIQL